MTLDELNNLAAEQATETFTSCCAAERWVAKMVNGRPYASVDELLKKDPNTLVSLMHANNEIGTVNDIDAIANLCHEHGVTFHTDTVQTMGHFKHDLQELKANFIVGSAHKFHGPKGVGFLYVNHEKKIHPFI